MKKIVAFALVSACIALYGCATTSSPSRGIKTLGPNLFSVSELSGYGSVAERAAAFCNYFGQRMTIEGNTSQKGAFSGDDYAELVFSCHSPEQ